MRIAWVSFWFLFGAVETSLAFWSRSATFLAMGALAPGMIAYNLFHDQDGPHTGLHIPIELTKPIPIAA